MQDSRQIRFFHTGFRAMLTALLLAPVLVSVLPFPSPCIGGTSGPTSALLDEEVLRRFTIGSYLVESGHPRSALEHFEIAWEKSLHHPTIGIRLAQLYYGLKKFIPCEAVVDEVLSQDSSNYTALLLKAKIRYIRRDRKGSLEYLEKIRAQHGASFEVEHLRGNIYSEIGQSEKAIEAYESAAKLEPNSALLQHQYGLLLKNTGRLEQAQSAFERAIALDPQSVESATELADILVTRGQPAEAESVLVSIVDRGYETDVVVEMLASLYLESGRLDHGIRMLEKFKQKGDLSRDSNILLGQMYYEAKEYEEAKRVFLGLFQEESTNADLARIIGDINLQSQKPNEALEYYRRAIELDPNNYRRYLGLFFVSSTRFAPEESLRVELSEGESLRLLQKASTLVDVGDFDGNYLVGVCYQSLDSLRAAWEFLSRALALKPDDEGTLLALANVTEKAKRYEEAEAYLEVLHKQKPDDPTICNFYGYLLAEMGKDLDRAEVLVRKALESEPLNGYYIDSLGWVFFQRGEYEKAAEELEKAADIVKDDPVILEHLGDAYRELERYDEALGAYQRSNELQGENAEITNKIESLREKD